MKKLALLITTFVFSILYINLVIAQSQVEITADPTNTTIYLGSKAEYNLAIKNNQAIPDRFIIFITGPHVEWINLEKYYVELNPGSARTIKLWFYLTNEEGSFNYKISVVSLENPDVKTSATIYLNIISPEKPKPAKLEIYGFDVEMIGNKLTVNLAVQSTEKRKIDVDFDVKDSKGVIVSSTSTSTEVYGSKNVSTIIYLPALLAGNYVVQVGIRETNLTEQVSFSIAPVHNITKSKKIVSSVLFTQITWSIYNLGNVIEYNYQLDEAMPEGFITFITPSVSCYDQTCKWVIDKIEPGGVAEISYRIEYWPLMLEVAVIVVVIICVVIFLWLRLTRPTVRKKFMKRKGKYTVVLEIKNSWVRKMTNVVVRDWVSPLARVYKKFETIKPVVRETSEGTELVWKLGTLQPREERILHYRIRPIVHGSLKMPKAYVRFKTEKGKKIKVYSRELILEV